MNYIIGSAPKIQCEVPSAQVTGTTVTLESLIDSDGTEWASSQSLTFGTDDEANIASYTWQSTEGTHPLGKYTFIVQTLNGTTKNFGKGTFYLKERT